MPIEEEMAEQLTLPPVNRDGIPAQLRERDQWVCWRFVERNGEPTKAPYQPNGTAAKSNDPSTWHAFADALAAYHSGRYDGVGFVFSAYDDFAGIDLDGCRNPQTGEVAPWAQAILDETKTYCEVSPSGTGFKLFGIGRNPLPKGKNWKLPDEPKIVDKVPGIELYSSLRYFCVTAQHVDGFPTTLERIQPQIDALCERFAPTGKPPAASNRHHGNNGASHNGVIGRAHKYLAKCDPAISGQGGHDTTYAVACNLVLGFDLSRDEAYPLLAEWNQRCEPPWTEAELRHKLEDADKEPDERRYLRDKSLNGQGGKSNSESNSACDDDRSPSGAPLAILRPDQQTDIANSRRFVSMQGDRVRFCHSWGEWLIWDGARWKREDDGAPIRLAKTVADALWTTARTVDDPSLCKFAAKTSDEKHIRAMLNLAKSDVPIRPNDMDANGWLLNCPNGTVDLRTGELRDHRREDSLTLLCPTRFNPDAPTYEWDRFLEGVFDGSDNLIGFIRRLFGYFLTADVSEQILPIFWGGGSNGKSTLLKVFMDVLGMDYSMQAVPDLLMAKRNDSQEGGARFVSPKRKPGALKDPPENRKKEIVESWKHLLRGLWWSGLRLEEALNLWWDYRQDRISVDLTGKYTMLHIPAELEKAHHDRLYPVAPEFAEFLLTTPESERTGPVLAPKPILPQRSRRLGKQQVGRVISIIGRTAGVKVHEKAGKVKSASAHDLRRSFGERWAPRVMPQVLMQLMRHESIETTLRFYVGKNAEATAEALYAAVRGNTFGNTPSDSEKSAVGEIDVTHY